MDNATKVLKDRVDGSCLTGDEVLAQISDAEKQLVKANNIDLTTCMVAKGADGKFHIYNANYIEFLQDYPFRNE